MSDVAGYVLPVDKPEGPTSHDVVQQARRELRIRRVGHTGTLDPFASGLLVLCVGRTTRIAEYLTELPKCYEAEALLGQTTDTDDREGTVLFTREGAIDLDRSRVEDAFQHFRGTFGQVPPQFSAKKVAGVAMHRRARRGEAVDLEPCTVTVYDLELLDLALPVLRFSLRCSSGTYVRSLARDIGEILGVGAHLTKLRRTQVGEFSVDDALDVQDLGDAGRVGEAAITPLAALGHLAAAELGDAEVARIALGQPVPTACADSPDPLALARGDELVGIAEARDGMLRPRKVFVS